MIPEKDHWMEKMTLAQRNALIRDLVRLFCCCILPLFMLDVPEYCIFFLCLIIFEEEKMADLILTFFCFSNIMTVDNYELEETVHFLMRNCNPSMVWILHNLFNCVESSWV